MDPFQLRSASCFAAIYLIWGSTYLAISWAVAAIPPFLMAGIRFLSAGALLFAWLRIRGAALPTASQWRSAAVIGILFFVGGNGLVSWAELRVPSSLTALLISTVPVWIVLVEWMRGRRPSAAVAAGVAIGLAGVALLVNPLSGVAGGRLDLAGTGALLAAALTWAVGSIYSRGADLPASPFMTASLQFLAGGTMQIGVGLALGEGPRLEWSAFSGKPLVSVLYLVFIGSIVAQSAYMWLLKNVPVERVATYAYVNPVVAMLLGWWIGREEMRPRYLAAGAVILAAVAIVVTARGPRPAPHASAVAAEAALSAKGKATA